MMKSFWIGGREVSSVFFQKIGYYEGKSFFMNEIFQLSNLWTQINFYSRQNWMFDRKMDSSRKNCIFDCKSQCCIKNRNFNQKSKEIWFDFVPVKKIIKKIHFSSECINIYTKMQMCIGFEESAQFIYIYANDS